MEKLNELVEALYPQYGAPGSRDVDISARRKAIDKSAAVIAEAFRALEQEKTRLESIAMHANRGWKHAYETTKRAEAAEAKLAELEKQEPYGWVNPSVDDTVSREYGWAGYTTPLFTRAAPAINLAELVLPVDGLPDNAEESQEYRTGFAMGCALYAKRIVELNPHLVRNIEEAK